jgi:outer membrane protein insertion porin family
VNAIGFMRRSGHLRAKTGEPVLQSFGRQLKVTVPVEEGELFRLGAIKIEGAKFFTAERLRELLPLKNGDIADGTALMRWLSEHLYQLYEESGFIHYAYEVEPNFNVNPDGDNTADFDVTIDEGPRFILRRLKFEGGGRIPSYVLRDAMLIREGEFFNARKYRDGVRRLNDLDLFEPIDGDRDATFVADEEAPELSIKIRLKEKP